MSASDINPEIGYKIHEALAEALFEESEGGILSRWVILTEHSLIEGGSSIAYVKSPGLSAWEVIGMAETVKIIAKETLLGFDDDEDDDE